MDNKTRLRKKKVEVKGKGYDFEKIIKLTRQSVDDRLAVGEVGDEVTGALVALSWAVLS